MKKITLYVTLMTAVFAWSTASSQEGAELILENGEFQITIPYLEFDGNAFEVELHTPDDSDDLFFIVDLTSLTEVELETNDSEVELDISEGACTATSNAAFLSCAAEVEEENFIARGNCFQESNSLSTVTCESLASSEMEEAEEECDDQWEARLMLCAVVGEDPYDPLMTVSNFMTPEEVALDPNPWFPLVPGNEWVYESEDETVTVIVTDETIEIQGITSIIVRDLVTEDGELIEDTDDYYAQDLDGNVWYMGEIAKNYEDGRLSDLDGSWRAGIDGAKAGILFKGNPIVGETLRQKFLLGEAEDIGETLSVTANGMSSEEAGVVCQDNCLQVFEYTPIEPEVAEEKFYYPGIGKILGIDLEEGEREELVEYSVQ
jgi:hypothetical protein